MKELEAVGKKGSVSNRMLEDCHRNYLYDVIASFTSALLLRKHSVNDIEILC